MDAYRGSRGRQARMQVHHRLLPLVPLMHESTRCAIIERSLHVRRRRGGHVTRRMLRNVPVGIPQFDVAISRATDEKTCIYWVPGHTCNLADN